MNRFLAMNQKQYIGIFFILFCSAQLFGQSIVINRNIRFSFSERVRFTTIDNAIFLDNDVDIWTFARFRTYAGAEYIPYKNLNLFLELVNESRIWFSPSTRQTRFDEIFINRLYLQWDSIGGLPAEIKLGRQNIMFDDGFVCFDGQPLVGSRGAYFNALKGEYSLFNRTKISAFISFNPRTDIIFPLINELNPSQLLEEQSNLGLGLYLQKQTGFSDLSVYYFRKNNYVNDSFPIESGINHFGVSSEIPFGNFVKFIGEGGLQSGYFGAQNIFAFGGHANIEYILPSAFPILKDASFGGFYLSGDDPQTPLIEGWNHLWSRWPIWSESYIYTLIPEHDGRVGYWSNIASLNANISCALSDAVDFKFSYHHLFALEDNTSEFCSGNGFNRGDLLIFKTGYSIDVNWSGHFLLEHFFPGDYYFNHADSYNWVRFELMYKI